MNPIPEPPTVVQPMGMKTNSLTVTRALPSPHRRIRLVLVDDHPAVLAGLEGLLADQPGLDVVAAVATAPEAYEVVLRHRPDLAILDYHLPGEDGVSLCYRLKILPMPPQALILSAFADDALALMALVAGADGVISKGAPTDLYDTATALVAGETRLPEISPSVLRASGLKLEAEDLPILGMLVHRVPPDDIADTLNISPARLALRRWRILERLRHRA